jgi:hypothetical protein
MLFLLFWPGHLLSISSFNNIKIRGETATADTVAAEEVFKELHHIIEKEGYSRK